MATEKRLIEADALLACFEAEYQQSTYPYFHMDEIADEIIKAPTVDAMEVVRCKDCHWWRHINKLNGCGLCSHQVFSIDDPTLDPMTEPTDFCSYGERKEK